MKWKNKTVLILGTETNLFLIDNFLSPKECSLLIKMARHKGMSDSAFTTRDRKLFSNDFYKSSITTFMHSASPTLLAINKRIEEFTSFPLENGEDLKILSYSEGGYFFPHNDYKPHSNKNIKGGCRVAQMLFYLNDVEIGGETNFPNIGIKVSPKKGRALFWYGIEAPQHQFGKDINLPRIYRSNLYALHEPLKVEKGEKWIASKILHNIPFDQETSYYKSIINSFKRSDQA